MGFLFFPMMTMGLRLAALRAAGAKNKVMNNHAWRTLTRPRDYVFTYKCLIKLPWGRAVSGTRDHVTRALLCQITFNLSHLVMPRIFIQEYEGGKGDCLCHPFEFVLVTLRTFHFTPLTIHAIYGASFGLFKSGLLLMIRQYNSYPLSFYIATSSPRIEMHLYILNCFLASFLRITRAMNIWELFNN